jgi:hypothetical protein
MTLIMYIKQTNLKNSITDCLLNQAFHFYARLSSVGCLLARASLPHYTAKVWGLTLNEISFACL